ncbi:MAG TPA: RluA family pseudouridine synthase [Thermoanaerobaculia bacterium]|jgi:RluA family pseudouridine synthase|nr:RluA family pseudouridine synthase [Thermoanaerobaculia bacterium]
MRLDQAIAERNAGISRRKARELIAARRVLVNERAVSIASREVDADDRIAIVEDAPELAIIRETEEWIAVDKPAGMPAQPTRDRKQRSLEELLRLRFREIWLVHRLDTPTSGVILFARSPAAAARLSAMFANGEIRKTYLAVLEGDVNEERVVDTPVQGKSAQTTFRPLRNDTGTTLVEASIETGRTHQIRIHAQSIGHPVAGDRRYGSGGRAARLMLHAWKLEHASFGVLEAPPPTSFSFELPIPR